jgi:hypothetical protein
MPMPDREAAFSGMECAKRPSLSALRDENANKPRRAVRSLVVYWVPEGVETEVREGQKGCTRGRRIVNPLGFVGCGSAEW